MSLFPREFQLVEKADSQIVVIIYKSIRATGIKKE